MKKEKSLIFHFPRILLDTALLFFPGSLKDFCVSLQQTPLYWPKFTGILISAETCPFFARRH